MSEEEWETDSEPRDASASIDEAADLQQVEASGGTTRKKKKVTVLEDDTASPTMARTVRSKKREVGPTPTIPELSSLPEAVSEEMTFDDVGEEFAHTLAGIEETFGTQIRSFDHQDMVEALHDGMQQAQTPTPGLTPQKLWSDVEELVKRSGKKEMERRDLAYEKTSNTEMILDTSEHDASDRPKVPNTPVEIARQKAYIAHADINARTERLISEVEAEEGSDVQMSSSPLPEREFSRRHTMPHTESDSSYLLSSPPPPPSRVIPQSTTNVNTGEQKTYTFTSLTHITVAPEMQNFYRDVVQHTLENLLNNTDSDETHELINQYWGFVAREVSATEDKNGDENETEKEEA
jgi:hypothetical protein